jgi:ribosomal protein S21
MQVEVIDGNMDGALRELKKKILRDNIFKEIKTREEPSPSMRRRMKARKARLRRDKLRMRRDGHG